MTHEQVEVHFVYNEWREGWKHDVIPGKKTAKQVRFERTTSSRHRATMPVTEWERAHATRDIAFAAALAKTDNTMRRATRVYQEAEAERDAIQRLQQEGAT